MIDGRIIWEHVEITGGRFQVLERSGWIFRAPDLSDGASDGGGVFMFFHRVSK